MVTNMITTTRQTPVEKKESLVKDIFAGQENVKLENNKPSVRVPKDLEPAITVVANGRLSQKELKNRLELTEALIKQYARRTWIKEYVRTGKHPGMTTYTNGEESIDFIQTSKILLTREDLDALEGIGFPIKENITTVGVTINTKALEEHGLVKPVIDAISKALGNLKGMTPEILRDILVPQIKVDPVVFNNLVPIIKSTLPAKSSTASVINRCEQVMEILDPVVNLRNPKNIDTTPLQAYEAAISVKLPNKGSSKK